MAAAAVDFSFLEDPSIFGKGRFADTQNELGLRVEDFQAAEPEFFSLAPVDHPETFCHDMKQSGQAPGMMDFKHGTTTLGFVFQHGIIIAVDSRASMGSYISSQTVKKVIESTSSCSARWLVAQQIAPFGSVTSPDFAGSMSSGTRSASLWQLPRNS